MSNQKCLPNEILEEGPCYVVFMKMTPAPQHELKTEDILDNQAFLSDIEAHLGYYAAISNIKLYMSADSSDGTVNYIVAQFIINTEHQRFPDLVELISLYHRQTIQVYTSSTSQTPVPLSVEFALYNKHDDDGLHVYHFDNSFDILRPFYVYPEYPHEFIKTHCVKENIILLHKLQVCQYVEMEVIELPITRVSQYLRVEGISKDFVLSDWEYKLISETLFICIEDLERIYAAQTSVEETNDVSNNAECHVCMISVFSACFFIANVWLFGRN